MQTVSRPDELMAVFDERGRELHITRASWVESALAPAIQRAWDDPQALAAQIAQAVHDDFAPQVRQAAERLRVLDHESETALVLAAAVHMECGDLEQAQAALDRCISKHGDSAAALTNLAKLHDRRGDRAQAKSTLRRSLDVDPNQDAVLWWATLAKEDSGEASWVTALEEITAVPGAWRPHLWIAREKLKQGDRPAALSLYQHVLAVAADRGDVLLMITGDLGNAGALDELVRLTAPYYKPEVHGPQAGMNLARALKQLGRADEARELVRRLQTINWPPFAGALAALEAEIVAASLPRTTVVEPSISLLTFERPLWTHGLFEPEWLFRAREPDEPTVAVMSFANEVRKADTPQVQMSEALGRFTRSLPLYLAERLGLAFRVKSQAVMLVSKAHGPVVLGEPLPRSVIEPRLPGEGRRFAVAGALIPNGVRLHLWRVGSPEESEVVEVAGSFKAVGALVAATERALTAALEKRGVLVAARPPAFYQPPSPDLLSEYVLALEQLFYQVLTASNIVSPATLWNERGFFETYFNLVEAWPNAPESVRLLAASGTVAAATYGSALLGPYRAIVLRWLDDAVPGSALYRVAPALFKRLGDMEACERALSQAPKLADAEYMAWLDRVREEGT